MPSVTDMMGRTVSIPERPLRIVSLVPSQTELLHYLEVDDRVVGITKFCIHPNDWFRTKQRIGGTKTVSIEKVRALNPDLIIGNKEENLQSDIEQLEKEFTVWMSDIFDLDDACEMIKQVGLLTQTPTKANELVKHVKELVNQLPETNPERVLYLIWNDPYMAAGTNTFIDHLLNRIGWENVCSEERYPELTDEAIEAIAPDRILLSSEPYPFKEKHIIELEKKFPKAKVELVDGEYFSWYGSRMIEAFTAFKRKIYRSDP